MKMTSRLEVYMLQAKWSGTLFYHNYPGGSGLMSGSVFGKTAGDSVKAYNSSSSYLNKKYNHPK